MTRTAAKSRPAAKGNRRPKTAAQRRRLRLGRRATLPLLALLLLSSGAIRLGTGAGSAIAREVGEIAGAVGGGGTATPEGAVCEPPEDIAEVLGALDRRESRVAEREVELDQRQAALDDAAVQIQSQLDELVIAEQELAATLAMADEAAEGDITQLTSVYENMKPKDAAALFETMDPVFAAGFLGRMQAESAAAIMAGLSPGTAYTVSVVLAGRNANAPTD